MEYLISLALVSLSALFSGLTLGLLSLDSHTLKRRAKLGDRAAHTIYPLRRHGNLLLSTLLLGNVAVNTILSVYLGSLVSGVVAVIIATSLIFILGEIVPQAIISRHAMWFGAKTAPFVRLSLFIFYPIAYPIAYVLDRVLGDEIPTIYSRHEILEIISEHESSEHSTIDEDEERIVHGALKFSHKQVREILTPRASVVAYEAGTTLDRTTREAMVRNGHSRYPVYESTLDAIIGVLYTKDVLVEPLHETAKGACERDILKIKDTQKLDAVLRRIIRSKQHLAIVFDSTDTFTGIITLEDIIEEILQLEIEDEDDAENGTNA